MRTLALGLILCSAACSTTFTTRDPQSPGATSRAPAEIAALHALAAAAEAKDAHAVAAVYAEDATVEAFGGSAVHGRAAIEASARRAMEPAASLRYAFGRVFLKGDVAIAESTFQATMPGKSAPTVGATSLHVFWFDADGRIQREHEYTNQATLDAQMSGDRDADPVPALPATMELISATDAPDDAAKVAWARAFEDKSSHSDDDALALLDDQVKWRCTLGAKTESRAELEPALRRWRERFPDERYEVTAAWPFGDFIAVEETMTGTQRGAIGPFAATNKHVAMHWAEIWEVKNGRITKGWSFANWNELEAQISSAPHQPTHAPCSVDP